ncbi:hypothetical protein [Pedobacter steynii]|uniref:Beta-propeller repeat-containing protein n=1 Tax=Pedobacter steynii TaxID=430522 RepID=A0A1D7QM71_9SPHI|nr:hypothetical protein [Pedobacter steynii]AOM79699.1 hypothetical protein BFS30_22585 [Pedobacter steynii]
MKNILPSVYLVLFCIVLNTSLKAQSTPGLYLTYTDHSGASNFVNYWKNGQTMKLTDGKNFAEALDIAVSGDDEYVAGYVNNNEGEPVAHYWKNGKATVLTDGKTYAKAVALTASGSDVHVIGNNGPIAMYWKNGIATKMGEEITLTDIVVAAGEVYISGYQIDDNGDYVATYWKNGQATKLATANPGSEANGIAVSGTDVYVAGKGKNENGKETILATGTSAKAISVSGNDVYVAGFERNPEGINIAVSWKNGQPTRLTDGKEGAGVSAMSVSGQDVYVAGYLEGKATYWKNGNAVYLPDVIGNITGTFIK